MGRSALAVACLLVAAACETEPARGELGRVELSYCDRVVAAQSPTCHASVSIAVGAAVLLFVTPPEEAGWTRAQSSDPSVVDVMFSGVRRDVLVLDARAPGDATLELLDDADTLVDRFTLHARAADSLQIEEPVLSGGLLHVRADDSTVVLRRYADGSPLAGAGGLALTFQGAIAGEAVPFTRFLETAFGGFPEPVADILVVRGPIEGGAGRISIDVPSAHLDVTTEAERAHVQSLQVRVVETSMDQGRIEADVALDAGSGACCTWSVGPVGPITIRREECLLLLVETSEIGVPNTAEVSCTVLDRTETVEVVVGL